MTSNISLIVSADCHLVDIMYSVNIKFFKKEGGHDFRLESI